MADQNSADQNSADQNSADKDTGDKQPDLDEEMDRLLDRLPEGAARAMKKVRSPAAKPYRIPVGVALTVGGVLGFMPLLGFWMVPLGLAVLAQDVPVVRRPTARLVSAINRRLKPSR